MTNDEYLKLQAEFSNKLTNRTSKYDGSGLNSKERQAYDLAIFACKSILSTYYKRQKEDELQIKLKKDIDMEIEL